MTNPSPDEGVRAGEWLTTAPNPNSSPFGFNGGQRGWKLHYVQGERAACGITARHGWGLDLHIETRCARCEAALAALSTPVPEEGLTAFATTNAVENAFREMMRPDKADAYFGVDPRLVPITVNSVLKDQGTKEGLPPGSASAAEGVQECFRSVALWADATFGLATPQARIARAGVELIEAAEATPDKLMEEIADTVICLIGAAHSAGGDLQAAIDAKMAINRARRWKVMGDGTGYHIPQDGSAEPGSGAASALPSPLPSQVEPVAWIVEESIFGQWRERIVTEKPEEGPRIRILGSLYTAETLAAERARADSEAGSRRSAYEYAEAWETEAVDLRKRLTAAEARADRAEEDERDRLLEKWSKMSAQWTDTAVWWLGNNGAMLPSERAALRARNILKETPHDER